MVNKKPSKEWLVTNMAMKKMAVKKVPAKKSPDTVSARQSAGLAKVGRFLSGKGPGSADTMAARGAARGRGMTIAVATARGGGQGKSSPMAKKTVGSMASKKVATKSVPVKKKAAGKPVFGKKSPY